MPERLTLGVLYGLAEDDPNYSTEAMLSQEQRDKLPKSAFCGPGKTFPAHDRKHVLEGLRLLPAYAGDRDRKQIRATLLESLKNTQKEQTRCLLRLEDEARKVSVPFFEVTSQDTPEEVLLRLEALGLSEADHNKALSLYASFALIQGVALNEALQQIDPAPADASGVAIKLTQENWPLLLQLAEERPSTQEWEQLLQTLGEDLASQEAEEDPAEALRALTARAEAAEARVQALESASAETTVVETSELHEANQLQEARIKEQAEDLRTLRQQILKLQGEAHRELASQVARLKKLANRRSARGKSFEELFSLNVQRTRESLNDDLAELIQELGETPVSPAPSPGAVSNPVRTENNGPTPITTDPSTGRPTIDAPLTEEADETFFLYSGLDPQKIEARTKNVMASYGQVP